MRASRFVFCEAMKSLVFALVLAGWVLAACGNDKPPMVPDPDTTAQPDAAAAGD